ncbi:TrmB family transcriptional regulator [Natrarchaeobius oligotrophus]|uniref:TrmB family transcriptional regulator n=1 Tax=Natrarchaeobius chitinivorans TaxID=1679083 RepID=A0A3N6N610_NATCH|nr:helix-turn-helix domain-containing protein [Natrarchaeobius chitinivorans]RQH03337.1 TrmB family transcriptional regulator [Natrarchaeobius chitinivorans]
MTQDEIISEAVSLLQDLGLKEYEARCFMALTQLSTGTAKEIHDISEVPRTRVYDAIRVLESEGLVEVQHSSPQRFRAVDINEATQTLRQKYDNRIETLETYLENTSVRKTEDDDQLQEVWSLMGNEAIETRMLDLIDDAESEIALLVVDEEIMSESLFDGLREANDRDLSILLGGQTEAITERLGTELPNVRTFESGLDWLTGAEFDHEVAISRILLVDRTTLLIGTYYPQADNGKQSERAVFANGLENGIVVLLRRLVSSGLTAANDPGTSQP